MRHMLCSYLLALLSSAAAYSQIQSQNISDSDDIYNSSSFVGYSLWLTPDSPDFLQEIIDEQAKDLGTKRFPPHITLLGGLEASSESEMISKCDEIGSEIKAFDAVIDSVQQKGLYFQCVFALIELSKTLVDAFDLAKMIFEIDQSIYMPHISLVYGDLDSATKAAIKQNLENRLGHKRTRISTLSLWNTTGPVENWHHVHDVKLID